MWLLVWKKSKSSSQYALNEKTFVMLRNFFPRKYLVIDIDFCWKCLKIFHFEICCHVTTQYFFTFIKIVSSFFLSPNKKINLPFFSDIFCICYNFAYDDTFPLKTLYYLLIKGNCFPITGKIFCNWSHF